MQVVCEKCGRKVRITVDGKLALHRAPKSANLGKWCPMGGK
jgi:hypothetical protein